MPCWPCRSFWHRQRRSPIAAAGAGEHSALFSPAIPSLVPSFQGLWHLQTVVTPPQTASLWLSPPALSSAAVFISRDLPPTRLRNCCPRSCQQASETWREKKEETQEENTELKSGHCFCCFKGFVLSRVSLGDVNIIIAVDNVEILSIKK